MKSFTLTSGLSDSEYKYSRPPLRPSVCGLMMKSVQSAALSLMMMMMMMMVSVSAGPLPPSFNSSDDVSSDRETNSSRFDVRNHGNNTERNFTRELATNNMTNDAMTDTTNNLMNITTNDTTNSTMTDTTNSTMTDTTNSTMTDTTNSTMTDTTNSTMTDTTNSTGISTFVFVLPMEKVVSPVMYSPQCVLPTCLTANLGSSLQSGDETAGGATTDPFGIGKK